MSRHRAQALVEAAIAAVPLLMVTVGIVQFTMYLYVWHVLDGAVVEGARIASAQDRTLEDGITYAQALVQGGIGPAGYLDTPAIDGQVNQDLVTLRAQSSLHLVIPLAADVRLPLQAQATVHKEQFRPGGTRP